MKKIAIITNSMFNSAGMERVLTDRANALCGDFSITIITRNQGKKKDFFLLDNRVRRIDLKVDNNKDYQDQLSTLLKKEHFDITTSTGGDEMWFLWKIHDGSRKIFEFHFSFDVSKVWTKNIKNPLKRRISCKLQEIHRIYHARHYDIVVALCKADARKWSKWCKNVIFTYNPTYINPNKISSCNSKTVIAVGRLDYQKGFDYLIKAWKSVNAKHPNWELDIWGDGELHDQLQQQIVALRLSDKIHLCGRTNDIASQYINSSIYVCSSRTEAFGLTIVEAETCGLPVITFASPNSPAELVDNGKNGYVISKVGDTNALAKYINRLIEDRDLRQSMGLSSRKKAKEFLPEKIIDTWKAIYNKTTS